MAELRVQVLNDDIIVTLPGSHYSVTYYKSAKSPQLVAKFMSDRDDPRVAMSLASRQMLHSHDKPRLAPFNIGEPRGFKRGPSCAQFMTFQGHQFRKS
jgi:hypothetical protein